MASHTGAVFWLTGLSGSGKTTIGKALVNALREDNQPVIFLDGDELREVTGGLFKHDRVQRLEASLLYARLCHMIALQNIHVVCATISLFAETQNWNRTHIARYIEVFVDVPLAEVMKRDAKGIYTKAQQGQLQHVVGIDIAPDYPSHPDIIIKNDNGVLIGQAVETILAFYHTQSLENTPIKDPI